MEPVSTILQDADDEAIPVRTEHLILSGPARGGASEEDEELSLVGRAERIFRHGQAEEILPPAQTRTYPDGYIRRSPPQPYRVPEGYYRRIAWKAALCVTAAVLLLLLVLALMKRGILRF